MALSHGPKRQGKARFRSQSLHYELQPAAKEERAPFEDDKRLNMSQTMHTLPSQQESDRKVRFDDDDDEKATSRPRARTLDNAEIPAPLSPRLRIKASPSKHQEARQLMEMMVTLNMPAEIVPVDSYMDDTDGRSGRIEWQVITSEVYIVVLIMRC